MPSGRRQDGQERAGRQLRRRQRRVLPIGDDGRLGEATAFVQHKGSSVDKGRQEAPHAHSINLDPANRFAFVADLGLDKVLVYRFDAEKGTLTPNDPPFAKCAAGLGAAALRLSSRRQLRLRDQRDELHRHGLRLRRRAKACSSRSQTISTLPEADSRRTASARPRCRSTRRASSSTARTAATTASPCSRSTQATGKLTALGQQPTEGKTPRNFGNRPERRLPAGRKPGLRHDRRVLDRPEVGQARPDREQDRSTDARLREVHGSGMKGRR